MIVKYRDKFALLTYIRTLRGPVFENVPISPVHFMVEDILFYFITI